MSIDENAFNSAVEVLNAKTIDAVKRGTVISPIRELQIIVEAYEAAKVPDQPDECTSTRPCGQVECGYCRSKNINSPKRESVGRKIFDMVEQLKLTPDTKYDFKQGYETAKMDVLDKIRQMGIDL